MADKLTKKELEQPDEFHTVGWHALQYLSEHRSKLYAGGAAVLLIIILAGAWYFYRLDYESRAQTLYSSAYHSYSLPGSSAADEMKGAYLRGVQIYEELVKKYPSSRAATLSFYNMGNLYFNIGEMEKAITAYKVFLKRSSDDILTALAYHGLGYCYEETKDYDNAVKSFEDSNKRVQGTRFEYMNYANIARAYEKMGRQKEAADFYRKAAGKTGDPLMEMLVKRKIAALAP